MNNNFEYFSTNNNSIYRDKATSITQSIKAYTTSGMIELEENSLDSTETPDGQNICAKIVNRSNGTIKYLIRLDPNGKLFNPFSIYGENKNRTFLDRICRSNQKFKEVSEKVANLYLKFLEKQNIALLTNAEREAE